MKLPSIIKNKWVIIGAAATVVVAVIIIVLVVRRRKKGGSKMSGKYFTISELCKSRPGYDNTPTEEIKANLQHLIDKVLDPMREANGKAVNLTSGYRSPAYNAAIGGAKNSQHMKGQAADLQTKEGREGNKRLFEIIRKQGNFDQLIDEKNYQWIHVSYNPQRQRHEILRYDGSKYHKIQ